MSAINTKYTDKELLELYNLPLEELLNEAKNIILIPLNFVPLLAQEQANVLKAVNIVHKVLII